MQVATFRAAVAPPPPLTASGIHTAAAIHSAAPFSTPSVTPSPPLFVGDYSSGDFSQWNRLQNVRPTKRCGLVRDLDIQRRLLTIPSAGRWRVSRSAR